jgi:hypothetical protein
MVDTATYDIREGYYICTSVSGGAIGQGCSSDLREADESICLSGIDGMHLNSHYSGIRTKFQETLGLFLLTMVT